MKEYYSKLREVKLFAGINESVYEETLAWLHAKVIKYKKGRILQLSGDKLNSIGIVLNGSIEISRTDFAGNRLIVNRVEYPGMFGEAFMFAGVKQSLVTVIALEDSTILKLDFKSIINDSEVWCRHLKNIVINILGIMAEKNLFLSSRLELITRKTIRAKIAAYLLKTAEIDKRIELEIPYNRNQLADYLSVNRSALSNELSKLRKEGILDFQKNKFTIHKPIVLSEIANSG